MNIIKKLTLTLIIASLLVMLIVPSAFAATATITVDTLRVRKAPSTSSDVLRNLDKGSKVEVLEKSGEWYKVKLSDGNEAYVYAEYVKLEGNLTTDEKTDGNKKPENNVEVNVSSEEFKLEKDTRIYILPLLFSNEIAKATETTAVKIVEKINNWVCVDYKGVQGWVFSKGTVAEEPKTTETSTETTTKTGYVNVSSAYVREKGSKNADIITSLTLNTEVTILSEKDGWYEIKLSDKKGYIFADLVSDKKTQVTSRSSVNRNTTTTTAEPKKVETVTIVDAEASETAKAVVAEALKHKKKAYVYGGSGPSSFDCSGLTMYVFKQFGISLPHNARTQASYGQHVDKSSLAPGDLLIFNDRANTSIGHCGIYIGNGEFIHAANSNTGVVITSVDSSYYKARYVDARRLV